MGYIRSSQVEGVYLYRLSQACFTGIKNLNDKLWVTKREASFTCALHTGPMFSDALLKSQ